MDREEIIKKAETGEGLTVEEIKIYQEAVRPKKQVYGKYGTLAKEYLENHKVILFPFNVDIYGVMKKWFIKINIPDIDTENNGIEREQNFWDYVLNNPAWERAVQWTMRHGVNKKSFQQRGAITQQYKELCKEFLKAYIDCCK